MSFVKYGDGKILSIVEGEELSDEQKRAVKKVSEELVKQSDESIETSVKKKLGNS